MTVDTDGNNARLITRPLRFTLIRNIVHNGGNGALSLNACNAAALSRMQRVVWTFAFRRSIVTFSRTIDKLGTTTAGLSIVNGGVTGSTACNFGSNATSFTSVFTNSGIKLKMGITNVARSFASNAAAGAKHNLSITVDRGNFFHLMSDGNSIFCDHGKRFGLSRGHGLIGVRNLRLANCPTANAPPAVRRKTGPAGVSVPGALVTTGAAAATSVRVGLGSDSPLPAIAPFDTDGTSDCGGGNSIAIFSDRNGTRSVDICFIGAKSGG